LPELAVIEGNQQVAINPDESISPSLFTFRSHFAAVDRNYYHTFMTTSISTFVRSPKKNRWFNDFRDGV